MTQIPPQLTEEMRASLLPPTLRIQPGQKQRTLSPQHVAAWCEKLVETMNRKLPARVTLERDGPFKLTIQVEVQVPQLDTVEPDSDTMDAG